MFFLNKDSFLKKKNVFIKKKQAFSTKKATTAIVTLILVVIIGLSGAIFFSSKNIDAEGYTDIWTNNITKPTEKDSDGYIKITSPGQLAYISAQYRKYCDKKIRLYADIDLSGHYWVPIKEFNGKFDGQGYTISKMHATADREAEENKSGLFESLQRATIKNVVFKECQAYANNKAGIVAGIAKEANINNITISNSSVVSSYNNSGIDAYAGGVCGYLIKSNLSKCFVNNTTVNAYNSNSITNKNFCSFSGGIAGRSDSDSMISSSYFSGDEGQCQCSNNNYNYAVRAYSGGISGYLGTGCSITKCYNTGAVYSTADAYGNYKQPKSYNGGIAGSISSATISDCFNKGSVSGYATPYDLASDNIGTVASGWTTYVKENSYNFFTECSMANGATKESGYAGTYANSTNYGTRTVTQKDCYTGGIAGYCHGSYIANSYNTGTVEVIGYKWNKATLYYKCKTYFTELHNNHSERKYVSILIQIDIQYSEKFFCGNIVGDSYSKSDFYNNYFASPIVAESELSIQQQYFKNGDKIAKDPIIQNWVDASDYTDTVWCLEYFSEIYLPETYFTIDASTKSKINFYAKCRSREKTQYGSFTTDIPYTQPDSDGNFRLDLYGDEKTSISYTDLGSNIWAQSSYINGGDPYIKAFYW